MSFLLNSSIDLVCSVSECLSWIFVLLNFLSIFYLTFCTFYKVNDVVKVIGFAWVVFVTAASTAIVWMHTCLFTIICAAFTGLMIFGLLYVMLKSKVEINKIIKPTKKEEPAKVIEEKQEEPEMVENFVGMEVTEAEADSYEEYINALLNAVEPAEVVEEPVVEEVQEPVVEEVVVEEPQEPVVESAPESYIFDDEKNAVVNAPVAKPNVNIAPIAPREPAVEEPKAAQPVEVKAPVVEEPAAPIHNKFTDIVVSQIEGMPEMEEVENKSREELVNELNNRPVMVRWQQVNFNTNGDEKKTRVKPKKEEVKPAVKPRIRGYQIETFLND